MTLRNLALALAAALLLLTPGNAFGQTAEVDFDLGVQGTWMEGVTSAGGAFGVGGRLGIGAGGLTTLGTFDWYFPDCGEAECTSHVMSVGLVYSLDIPLVYTLEPYVGAGASFLRFEQPAGDDLIGIDAEGEEWGFTGFAGLELGSGFILDPFLEARYLVMDRFGNRVRVVLGLVY